MRSTLTKIFVILLALRVCNPYPENLFWGNKIRFPPSRFRGRRSLHVRRPSGRRFARPEGVGRDQALMGLRSPEFWRNLGVPTLFSEGMSYVGKGYL